MEIKVGDVYEIDGKFYVVTRKVNKPYSLVIILYKEERIFIPYM